MESGETPSAALRRRGLRPRKRLGQNFLHERAFLHRIADAAQLEPDDRVLEIGAGTGVLTRVLLERAGAVTAVELDDALYELLREEFAGNRRLQLWHGNALDFDPCEHFTDPYKLVGNIPYYVTGPILRHFLETPCRPSLLVLMVQKEVADRMAARAGELSLLGVSVQYYAEPRVVARVPAGAFFPPPKVDSAIIRLVPREIASAVPPSRFFPLARAGFSMPRKQLGKVLARALHVDRDLVDRTLQDAGIEPQQRAESLSVSDWERLASIWPTRIEE